MTCLRQSCVDVKGHFAPKAPLPFVIFSFAESLPIAVTATQPHFLPVYFCRFSHRLYSRAPFRNTPLPRRNPYCFRPLVCQRLAWLCVSSLPSEQAEPALSALGSVAHSGYGQGVLESLMELGGDQATAAVTTAAIVVR